MAKVGGGGDRMVDLFLRNYNIGKTLGIGATGKVKAAEHRLTGLKVAIKILNRYTIAKMGLEDKVRREIKIMKLFMHPHIVQLYEVIETPIDTYIVMEHAESGELFDYIGQRGRLKEDEARRIFQQIISGVEHCHRNMVVHRDLKAENVLLDANNDVKIADFGFSNIMYDGHFLKTSCGSPDYAAPEVICGKLYAGPEVDTWSCGVILYALLCGFLPFDPFNNGNFHSLRHKIKNGVYTLPCHLSPAAKDLISRILVVDPLKRITIPQIRQHPWFLARLPRYLAVKPLSIIQSYGKIDENVLENVVRLGFERNRVVESLRNNFQNQATVTYYLLAGNQSPASSGYLGVEFQESMEHNFMRPSVVPPPSLGHMDSQVMGVKPQMLANGKWALGLQAKDSPRDIMIKVLKVLQELNVYWKKIGDYNMKCKLAADSDNVARTNHRGPPSDLVSDSQHSGNGPVFWEVNNVTILQNVVKFELQLYKIQEEKYLLDLQRLQGPQFLFLNLCAAFITQLRVV